MRTWRTSRGPCRHRSRGLSGGARGRGRRGARRPGRSGWAPRRLRRRRQARSVEDPPDGRRAAPPGRGHLDSGRGHVDTQLGRRPGGRKLFRGGPPLGGPQLTRGARFRCGPRQRLDEHRAAAAHDVGGTALVRARMAEVDGVPVEPHAGGGVRREAMDGPRGGDGDLIAAVLDRPGPGAGPGVGGADARGAHNRRGDRRVPDPISSPADRCDPCHSWRFPPQRPI